LCGGEYLAGVRQFAACRGNSLLKNHQNRGEIMRYKLLGRSELRVPELCLGTMTFGKEWGWGASLDEGHAMFDAFCKGSVGIGHLPWFG
jgi:hypothetical protein